MKVAYNKLTGEYVDNEQSAPRLACGFNPANLESLGPDSRGLVAARR